VKAIPILVTVLDF